MTMDPRTKRQKAHDKARLEFVVSDIDRMLHEPETSSESVAILFAAFRLAGRGKNKRWQIVFNAWQTSAEEKPTLIPKLAEDVLSRVRGSWEQTGGDQ